MSGNSCSTIAYKPTVVDMLITTPPLLEACTSRLQTSVKTLRLVSPEMKGAALKSVKRAYVQLGEGGKPAPEKIALLLKCSRLESLVVTVITTPGGEVSGL